MSGRLARLVIGEDRGYSWSTPKNIQVTNSVIKKKALRRTRTKSAMSRGTNGTATLNVVSENHIVEPDRVREVSLVEVSIENLTYAPVAAKVASSAAAASGGGPQNRRLVVLNNVSTKIAPYTLTAWMGPSGSGKTSLISVAADLVQSGDVRDGSLITVNGEEGRIPKRLVGVVWQDDLLLSNLTVEENLYFAARLKTPETTSNETVQQVVAETMKELGLIHIRGNGNGNGVVARGISGGERKRVAVGAELVARPSCLLLDEITSGLDSSTAQSLMATLKDLARHGHSIAVVIHQPRTAIYNMFDHLLLLSRGQVVYNGHPSHARAFLEAASGQELPLETGIADWMMDIVTEDERRTTGPVMPSQWAASVAKQCLATKPMDPKYTEQRRLSLSQLKAAPSYNTGFYTQLKLLTHRTVKQHRGERLTRTALLLQLMYLFCTALFWWRIPDTTARIFERNSLLFFMLIAQANGIVIAAVTVFQRERVLLSRERAKKMYHVSSYFLAKTVSDMTNNVLLPVLYSMIVYWTAGFRVSAAAYFKNIFTFYWTFSTAQSMGLFLSILIPNPQMALVLAPPITLFFMILGGFYVPFATMHPGIEWASYLSFARYGYSALV
jgi:ABC-type multidrug transport system ATPase subunit